MPKTAGIRPMRSVLLGVMLVSLAAYVAVAVRAYWASRYAAVISPETLERAVRLARSNAAYHDQLGRAHFYIRNDVPAAIAQYRQATELNPHVGRYWLDLAAACQFSGDVAAESQALERALAAEPKSPDVAWEAASFYLVAGDIDRALAQFRIVIEGDPTRMPQALALCWRGTQDWRRIERLTVSSRPEPGLELLHILMTAGREPEARELFSRIMQWGRFEPRGAFFYIDGLLERGEADAAAQAWRAMAQAIPELAGYQPQDNLIVNAGFERDILNGGLDWRYRPDAHAKVSIETGDFHSGTRSLSVTFDGGAALESGLVQVVPVQPNTGCELAGYLKPDDIVSASGPRFAVVNWKTGAPIAMTDDVLATEHWVERRASFRTGPDVHVIAIKILRARSAALIKGRVLVDDLSLVCKPVPRMASGEQQ